MKQLLKFIFLAALVLPTMAQAQRFQDALLFGEKKNRVTHEFLLGLPSDTFPIPTSPENMRLRPWIASRPEGLYLWSIAAQRWNPFSGGGGGAPVTSVGFNTATGLFTLAQPSGDVTTSLEGRYLRYLDTTAMLAPFLRKFGWTPNRIPYVNASGEWVTTSNLTFDGNNMNIGDAGFFGTSTFSLNSGRGYFSASGTGFVIQTGSGTNSVVDASKTINFRNNGKSYLTLGSRVNGGTDNYAYFPANVAVQIDTLKGTGESPLVVTANGTLKRGTGGTGGGTTIAGTGVVIGTGGATPEYATGAAGQLLRRNTGNTAYEFFTPPYITGNQSITLSGPITGSGTTAITTSIANNAVENTHLGMMGSNTLKGNNTGGVANPANLSTTQVRTMLAINNVDNTSDATKFSATATLTNKTISGANNTLTNIAQGSIAALTDTLNLFLRKADTISASDAGLLTVTQGDARYLKAADTVSFGSIVNDVNIVNGNLEKTVNGTTSVVGPIGGGTSANAVLNNQSNTFQSGHKQSFDGEVDFLAGGGRAVYFRGGFFNYADADFVNPNTGIYNRTSWGRRYQSFIGDASGGVSVRAHGSLGLDAGIDSTGGARVMTLERGGLIQLNGLTLAGAPSTTGGWGVSQVLTMTNDGYVVKKPLSDFGTSGGTTMPLYSGLGTATDGPMTQAATTDAINGRAPLAHTHAAGDVNSGTFSGARLATGTQTDGHVVKLVAGVPTWQPDATGAGGGGGDVTAAGNNTFTGENTFNNAVTHNGIDYRNDDIDFVTPGKGIIFRDGSNNRFAGVVGDAAGGVTLGARGNFGISAGLGTATERRLLTIQADGLVQHNNLRYGGAPNLAGGWGINSLVGMTSEGYEVNIPSDSVLRGVRVNGTTYRGTSALGIADLGTIGGGAGGTLQQVTDAGATTTNKITAAGFNSGNTASQSSVNPGFELYNSGGNYYGFNLGYFGTKYATTALMPAGGNFVVATTTGDGTQAGLTQQLIVDGSTGGVTVMGGEVTFGTVAKIKEYTNYLALLTPNQSAAIPLKVGGLTVSDTYADANPANGLFVKGATRLANLAGVDARMVVAGTDGTLTTQAIPSGGTSSPNTVLNNQPNTYTAGSKQTFVSGAETAGVRFGGGITVNPTALTEGDLWYRQDEKKFRYYDGAVVREFVTAALAQTLTNKTISGADNTITNLNASNLTSGAVPRAQLSNMRVLKGIKFVAPTATEQQFIFRTAGAISVQAVDVVIAGTSPSVTYAVHYGTTYGTSQGTIVASTTATTVGTPAINVSAIPAGSYVWLTTSATSGTVTDFTVQISYILQ